MAPRGGKRSDLWAKVGFYSSLGFILPGAVVGGLALGWYLDEKLHSKPLLTLVLAALGAVAGFIEILRLMTREEKREARNDADNRDQPS
ncbi:MAG: AtpZ/AtpI family protein [Acidobacteriia bacterium]|nr:AtpZ/AtpI family protein [Terriglobia bacterium]